jgi:prolyl-tRNA synthetase
VQVVVVAVKDDDRTIASATKIADAIEAVGIRVKLDARPTPGFGRRTVEWELKGVPIRVEVGPRDLDAQQVTVARRDEPGKFTVPLDNLPTLAAELIDGIQVGLFEQARRRLADNTPEVSTLADAIEAAITGFARIPYSVLGEQGEDALAERAMTVRCLQTEGGNTPTERDAKDTFAVVARSY